MAVHKIKVMALRPFSHGNVDASEGGTYEMVRAEALELEKAGFVSLDATDEATQTQVEQPAQVKQPGDVVVDDSDDLLGEGKAAADLDNKMASPASNKRHTARK